MDDRPSLIVIQADTLRQDFLGCYGNKSVHTPHIDAFASESVRFTEAYPEALPTIVVRRALHTGRRTFPFRNYQPVKWQTVILPGWQPLENEDDTLAENLSAAGYHTGLVTDIPHYFGPGMNFQRGFLQWEFVRGQAEDRWQSRAAVTDAQLAPYGDPAALRRQGLRGDVVGYLANNRFVHSDEDTTTARVFRYGMEFLEDNRRLLPVYLFVDCFVPHEPWLARPSYLGLYAKGNYVGQTYASLPYGPLPPEIGCEELQQIQAQYCGLITMFDEWFGRFVTKMKRLGYWDRSLIVLTSDHGTNFGDNAEHVGGKPHYGMFPGLMRLPLLVRFPRGIGAGRTVERFVYNIDITSTLYAYGTPWLQPRVDGQDLTALLVDTDTWRDRTYLTSRYGNSVWYRDQRYWLIADVEGQPRALYDLQQDPGCRCTVHEERPSVVAEAWVKIMADAGGEMPVYQGRHTNALGEL